MRFVLCVFFVAAAAAAVSATSRGSAPPTPLPVVSGTPAPSADGVRRRLGDESVEHECSEGLEMQFREGVGRCHLLYTEDECSRMYETAVDVITLDNYEDEEFLKNRKAYLSPCKWFGQKPGNDGTAGRSVCAAVHDCVTERSWADLQAEWLREEERSGKRRNRNRTRSNNQENTVNGNSGSDSPPEVEPVDLLNPVSAAPTLLPTSLPTALPTSLPTALPTVLPTFIPSAVPTYSPSAAPTASPTPAPTLVRPRRILEPRCGKVKLMNKRKAEVVHADAADAMECYRMCSDRCSGCENNSWSFKSGSKPTCTCFGTEAELKIKESGEFFGSVDLGTVPLCGSIKAGKKGTHSVSLGKRNFPRVCQYQCSVSEGEVAYEHFSFKYDKDGKLGDCVCVSGKVKKKHTLTFGSTN